MGFAYRKTGDYAKALEMYDKALALQPGFPDAIEYRGEAYLALNRIDDAKQAYLECSASRPQAGRHADGGDEDLDCEASEPTPPASIRRSLLRSRPG